MAGIDCGKMFLKEVTWDSMMEQSKVLCRICGHWNPMTGPLVTKKVSETGTVTGPFWAKAIAEYRSAGTAGRVSLPLYGVK